MRNAGVVTPRLMLRPFAMEDAPAVMRLSREETLRHRMPDQVYETQEDARKMVSFLAGNVQTDGFPFVLAVALKETGELIGHIGLSPLNEGIEIGYAIAMAHQGRGYATEAVTAFSPWALQRLSMEGILAVVEADNFGSRRVVEKAGYVFLEERTIKAFGRTALCRYYAYRREGGE